MDTELRNLTFSLKESERALCRANAPDDVEFWATRLRTLKSKIHTRSKKVMYKYVTEKYGNPGVEIVGSSNEIVGLILAAYPYAELQLLASSSGRNRIVDQDGEIVAEEV